MNRLTEIEKRLRALPRMVVAVLTCFVLALALLTYWIIRTWDSPIWSDAVSNGILIAGCLFGVVGVLLQTILKRMISNLPSVLEGDQ